MSSVVEPATAQLGRWTAALSIFALGLAVLGFIFAEEVTAAVRTWDRSTAYNHCWLVLPIAIWLAWVRRDRLAALTPQPTPAFGLLALGGGLAWLLAERLGIMEGRQFAVIGLVWVLALAVYGWRVCLAMAGPLAYLIFLVPFGEFLTPALQDVTLALILVGLRLTGIPHYVDGLVIEIPSGMFLVAEACAGLRFIIAALAFGALYALEMFRSPGRRLMVMVLAIVVPVLANGVRALGIVLLGNYLGSAEAGAADHLVYGWVFFSVVILLLVLLGLPFRQDRLPRTVTGVPAALPRQASWAKLALAASVAVVLAAGAPLSAAQFDATLAAPVMEPAVLTVPAGCEAGPGGTSVLCPGGEASARLIVFAARTNWSAVAGARRRAINAEDDESLVFGVSGPGVQWQARQSRDSLGVQAAAAWLGGAPAGDGLRSRATQAWNAFTGHGGTPVLLIVELRPAPGGSGRERQVMQMLLEAQHDGLASRAAERSRPR